MSRIGLAEEPITRDVIGAFFEVYNTLGYGFLEHVYGRALERELTARGLAVAREVGVRVLYKGEPLCVQRLDMVVAGKVIVEIKSAFDLQATAERQLYNYLRSSSFEVGLLLHFGPVPRFYRLYARNLAPGPGRPPPGS